MRPRMRCSSEEALARCGRARGKQDWSSPCRQPCSTLQGKTVPAGCGSVRRFGIDREVDGKRRLNTPDEMQQTVASLKEAGFTAVRLELAGALEDEMRSRGERAPPTATRRRCWAVIRQPGARGERRPPARIWMLLSSAEHEFEYRWHDLPGTALP